MTTELWLLFAVAFLALVYFSVQRLRTFSWNLATAGLALMMVGVVW